MKKRLLAFFLAVSVAVSLLIAPASAAQAVRFTDISDTDTAVAVEALRLMGILDGYGDNTFRPDGVLTRAQFCKMAAYAMNADSELGLYSTVTVFPDVKPSHWASAYINLAAKGKSIIAGYPDGQFHPEETVTLGQAVTILLRLLGYKDEEIGGVWPDSYMAVAARIELTDGVGTNGSSPLTRGQAARLFLNLLRSDMAEGGSYLSSIGASKIENVVLVTSTAKGPDGLETSLKITSGEKDTYQLASNKVSNGALNGYRGTLVLNKNGKVLTFLPDAEGSSRTITLASAKATQIVDVSGGTYTVTSSTKAYRDGEESTWANIYSWLTAGTSITLYLSPSGGVEYIFVGAGAAASAAIVVYEDNSLQGFTDLTGGSTNYSIYKNGAAAVARDVRRWDVATYSAATNSIRLCDTRITGYYEACSPSPSEPSTVTVLGHEFPVLTTAQASLARFKPGDQLTLLLTEDNQVAGALEAQSGVSSNNAVGILKSNSKVELLCGISVEGTIDQSNVEQMIGQVVRVSSTKAGYLNVTRLTGGQGGDLDVAMRMLGSKALAANAMIFRITANGAEAVNLSDLTSGLIPSDQVTYARTNWADKVDLIVIGSAVGSVFYYGRARLISATKVDENGDKVRDPSNDVIELDTGSGIYRYRPNNNSVSNGEFVGISLGGTGDNAYVAAVARLIKVANVPNGAWSGHSSVTVNGRTYQVNSDVLCWNKDSNSWLSGLDQAHAYDTTCTLYIHNNVVRIVEVGS